MIRVPQSLKKIENTMERIENIWQLQTRKQFDVNSNVCID